MSTKLGAIHVVKEVILVIPKKNDIDVSEKTSDFLLQTAIEYYKENHPDNEILVGFSHSDESTNHCHLFINMKNLKTNEYDFVKQEQAIAERNKALSIREQPKPEDFEHPNRTEKRKSKLLLDAKNRWRGETLQRVFYKKFNQLSQQNNMKLEAVFNVKSSSTDEAYKFMNEQSKLPKHLRQLSFIHLQTETMQKKLEEQNEATNKVINTRKKNEVMIQKQIDDYSKRENSLKNLNVQIDNTEQSLKRLNTEEAQAKERVNKIKQDEETHKQSIIQFEEKQKESIKKFTLEYFTKIFDEMKTLYQQVLGLKPFFDRNLKQNRLGKVFFKNDLLDEEEFDSRVKEIVRTKSTSVLELYNSIDRHYDKNDKELEARTKKWTQKEVKHRAANNRTSENEFTHFLDRSAPESRPTNSQSRKNKYD